ncbi:MAG: DUF2849 domain-containing protein [Gluconacetobacter diazotrophicus]|nr:DUF2849 domain-containing protein [Gluconacetobacter diazotrophicus]
MTDVRSQRREQGRSSVVTANDLLSGEVLWLASSSGGRIWQPRFEAAMAIPNQRIAAALDEASAVEPGRLVVGIYGVELDPASTPPMPVTERERIRARGPTVRLDLGPQAAGAGR